MNEKKTDWSEVFTLPAILAIAGSILLFAGTFMELGHISILSFKTQFNLNDLGLERQVLTVRLLCLLSIAVICIPKLHNIIYSVCITVMAVLFLPSLLKAWKGYTETLRLMQATGLNQYFDINDYLIKSMGYYVMLIGAIIMVSCAAYFAIEFFMKSKGSD